jgi:tryptophanyl-tRNA synthetase
MTSKGLMNRAHAYKASVDANQNAGKAELDDGVTMGLFSYPVLMAADILMFNADIVPVGKDQIQHIEMTRDVAGRFNSNYRQLFTLPEAQTDEQMQLIPGLDGRKMSKSYDNTIPLFCAPDTLNKLIKQIDTDSKRPGEPKDPDTSTVFQLYDCFASDSEVLQMREKFANGIGWGEAKQELFEYLEAILSAPRKEYNRLMNDLAYVESVLLKGAQKARATSAPFMDEVRRAVGIQPLPFVPIEQAIKVKKEKTTEDLARAVEGRRRGILMQLKLSIEAVHKSEDSHQAATELLDKKRAALANLKSKAKEKAENELEILIQALAKYT